MSRSTPSSTPETPAGGSSRAAFLARVRSAVLAGAGGNADKANATNPSVDDALLRLERGGPDLVGRFERRAAGTGMTVTRCRAGELAPTLASTLAALAARRATVSVGDVSVLAAVDAALKGPGVERLEATARPSLDAYFDADVGITDVVGAIAESGTLILSSDAHGRGSFLVPPVHIAIVRAAQIVPDMLEVWPPGVPARAMPASLVLVTGPSKTADIEGILITGVHGPREVRVIVVEPDRSAA